MGTGTHVDTESSCLVVKAIHGVKLSLHLNVGSSLRKRGAAPTLPLVPSLVYTGTTVSLFYHGLESKNALIPFVRYNCFGRLEIKCGSNQTYCRFSYGEENFGKILSLFGNTKFGHIVYINKYTKGC
jgi:hypothetical protein